MVDTDAEEAMRAHATMFERKQETVQTTRAIHIVWAKRRALEFLDGGRPGEAIASLLSDLGKHEETENSVMALGLIAPLYKPSGDTMKAWSDAVRKWIEEVN